MRGGQVNQPRRMLKETTKCWLAGHAPILLLHLQTSIYTPEFDKLNDVFLLWRAVVKKSAERPEEFTMTTSEDSFTSRRCQRMLQIRRSKQGPTEAIPDISRKFRLMQEAVLSVFSAYPKYKCAFRDTCCRLRAKGRLKPSESTHRQSKKMHLYCAKSRARLPAAVPP